MDFGLSPSDLYTTRELERMSSNSRYVRARRPTGLGVIPGVRASQRARSAGVVAARRAVRGTPSTNATRGYSFRAVGGRELNFVDTNSPTLNMDTTGSVVLLNGIVPGSSASQRIGRKVVMKSILMTGVVVAGSTGSLAYGRLAVVVDTQANAAVPLITDIWDAITAASNRNISNMPRFKVLYDSNVIAIQGNSTTPTEGSSVTLSKYIKVNIPVQYNVGTAGTIGDIQTNALYVVSFGSGVAGTTAPTYASRIRVRYDDSN